MSVILISCLMPLRGGSGQESNSPMPTTIFELKVAIDRAYYTFDKKLLKDLLATSNKLLKDTEDEFDLNTYAGILSIQLGKIYYNIDTDSAYSYFDQSIDYFSKAFEMRKSAEAAALLSSAYGKKSSLSPLRAFYFGYKANDWIHTADTLQKNCPKVYLIAATHLMHTPKAFGGDKSRSESLLKKALKIAMQNKSSKSNQINWACEAEILAYLAQLEILRENKLKAKQYIEKALAIIPEYGFVKFDMIPQLKKIK